MAEATVPVTVELTRPDGKKEHVQIGLAVRGPTGFQVSFGQLYIGGTPVAALHPEPANRTATTTARPALKPATGMQHTIEDLESMAGRARRALADPRKAKWHDHERMLLGEIEAELERKRMKLQVA